MSDIQCKDLNADRSLGQLWEREFAKMAAFHGKCFTAHQWHQSQSAQAYAFRMKGWKHYTLPDVTIWTSPGEHHEIKHKNRSRKGYYGLEKYRFECLLDFAEETRQPVYYTIHDHDLAGGKENKTNNIDHWRYLGIDELIAIDSEEEGTSWVNGSPQIVMICYWFADRFHPLMDLWGKACRANE